MNLALPDGQEKSLGKKREPKGEMNELRTELGAQGFPPEALLLGVGFSSWWTWAVSASELVLSVKDSGCIVAVSPLPFGAL